MIRILIILIMFGCIVLNISLRITKNRKFKKVYKTPILSSLKGKDFSNYMKNITRDL